MASVSVSAFGSASRRRGIAAMQDPDAGLAFVAEAVPQCRLPPWLRWFLLAACLAFLTSIWATLDGYMVLLLAVGIVLFRLTAMDAAVQG